MSFLFLLSNCSSDDNNEPEMPVNSDVKTKAGTTNGAAYKVFYQETSQPSTRRGLIILAVGDGGNENDATLNAQCTALADKGYVAITTTYRTNSEYYAGFKEDMEQLITTETTAFSIARNKVVLGGLSRGGNRLHGAVLPANPQNNSYPIEGIKGVILECAGGDVWKGKSILYPVLFMNNKVDNTVQTPDAETFVNGLQENVNPGVKDKSKTLIVPGAGHCTNANQYKDFIINNIDSWF
ncbi:hypothetical protein G6R40_05480 [Chryseobacterium sp. POL2]|uniref:hypothetical protein n=1 Tax=Chryseobacterium sp. POL2 TaxID=2713414 RepID=UPI0013E14351|nr:hypothetical protein [Chryseobacterium sp. POL2]QIG89158.1 hypothetical protein G6R40_05480 [Chryseobacterium sp. POL2]